MPYAPDIHQIEVKTYIVTNLAQLRELSDLSAMIQMATSARLGLEDMLELSKLLRAVLPCKWDQRSLNSAAELIFAMDIIRYTDGSNHPAVHEEIKAWHALCHAPQPEPELAPAGQKRARSPCVEDFPAPKSWRI